LGILRALDSAHGGTVENTLYPTLYMSARSKMLFHNNMFMICLSLNNTGSPKHGRFVTMLQNEFMCL